MILIVKQQHVYINSRMVYTNCIQKSNIHQNDVSKGNLNDWCVCKRRAKVHYMAIYIVIYCWNRCHPSSE